MTIPHPMGPILSEGINSKKKYHHATCRNTMTSDQMMCSIVTSSEDLLPLTPDIDKQKVTDFILQFVNGRMEATTDRNTRLGDDKLK